MAFANFVAMAVTTSMYEKADESAEVVVQMMLVSGVDALKIAVIIANGDVANNVSSAKKKKKRKTMDILGNFWLYNIISFYLKNLCVHM